MYSRILLLSAVPMIPLDTLLTIRVNISHGLTNINCGGVTSRGVVTPRSLFDQHESVK